MTNKLLIYGTLGPGRPNEHILKASRGLILNSNKETGTWLNT